MEHLREEIRIDAPVEHVWAFYCDTTHWTDIMPRIASLEVHGPIDKVGTTYVASMRLMGFEIKSTFEIVEVEAQRLIHEHTDNGPMDNTIHFEPDGEGTRVVIESDWQVPGHWPGFIKDLVAKGMAERSTRHMLSELKALSEATVPALV
jgi:uncharacterized membrane protein